MPANLHKWCLLNSAKDHRCTYCRCVITFPHNAGAVILCSSAIFVAAFIITIMTTTIKWIKTYCQIMAILMYVITTRACSVKKCTKCQANTSQPTGMQVRHVENLLPYVTEFIQWRTMAYFIPICKLMITHTDTLSWQADILTLHISCVVLGLS